MPWFEWPLKLKTQRGHSVQEALTLSCPALLVPIRTEKEFFFAEEYVADLSADGSVLHPIPDVDWQLVAAKRPSRDAEKHGVRFLPMKQGYFLPVIKMSARLTDFFQCFEQNSRAGAFGMGAVNGGVWDMGWQPYMVTLPDGSQQKLVRQVIAFATRTLKNIEESDDPVEVLAKRYIQRFDVEFDFPTRSPEEAQKAAEALKQKPGERDEDYLLRFMEQTGETLKFGELEVRISA